MQFIKRAWVQIQAQLEGLTASQKWLIGTLLVLGLLVVGILLTVAGQPQTVAIGQFASSRSGRVLARLRSHGIDAEEQGGQLRVPNGQRDRAISLMVEGDLLTDDTSAAFDALISAQSPWTSDSQNQRAYLIAKQKVLTGIIRKMKGVRSAAVVIDRPRNQGFGKTYARPTASVTVTTGAAHVNTKQLVQAVSALISGAIAQMKPTDVKVIVNGRMYKVDAANEMLPSDRLAYVRKLEQYHQRKINALLSYIPDVRVAVNVQVDQVAHESEKAYEYARSEPLRSEEIEDTSRQNLHQQGEPGVRPNTGLDISGSGGSGMREKTHRESRDFADKPLLKESRTTRTGHTVKQINVTVNVPRHYFVRIYKSMNSKAKAEPSDATLKPIMTSQLAQIRQQVEPMIQSQAKGQVVATMIPDQGFLASPSAPTPTAGVGAMLANAAWVKPAGVGLLALLSVALMLFMVRKATQNEALPSVEQLSGAPPRLDSGESPIGEADDEQASMTGVEVDESQLKSRKIAEQINDLVKNEPREAGAILGRWVRTSE